MNKEQEIMLKRIKKEIDKNTRKWYLFMLDEHTKILTDKIASFYLPSNCNDFNGVATIIKKTNGNTKVFDTFRTVTSKCIMVNENLFEKQFGKHECLTFADIGDKHRFQKKYFKLLPKRNVSYGYYYIDVDVDNVNKKIPIFTFRHKDGDVLATILPVVAND